MNFEKLITFPVDLARLAGRAVLYGAEVAFPANPSIETRAANITIHSTPPAKDKA